MKMPSSAPLLNKYKRPFVKYRIVQTTFGGTRMYLPEGAPLYIYLTQIFILFLPAVVGIPFIALPVYDLLRWDICCYISGAVFAVTVLMCQVVSRVLQSKSSSVEPDCLASTHRSFDDFTEVEFSGCCDSTTASFILPLKLYKVNIVLHSIVAGCVLGLGVWFLKFSDLSNLYGSETASVVLSAFSWLTICFGLYSLTAATPEEVAVYRTPDIFESQALTRSFHMMLFFTIHIISQYVSGFTLANQIGHAVFAALPLLWTFGFLPHIEPFVLWACEQILIHAFGGSSMLSGLRIITMLLVSLAVYLVILLVPNTLLRIVLMSLFGYLLAVDLGGVGARVADACCMSAMQRERAVKLSGFLWSWHVFEVLFHCLMCAVSSGLGTGMHLLLDNSTLEVTMNGYFGYAAVGFFSLDVVLCELQKVYVVFGLLRNPLFPKCIQSLRKFEQGKRLLTVFGYCRRVCINYVSPCVLLVYLTTSVTLSGSWLALLAEQRAFRSVWQYTEFSLFDVTVQFAVARLLPASSGWRQFGVGVQLLLIAFIRSRCTELCHKMYAYFIILVSTYAYKKQRHKHATLFVTLNIVFFPLVFALSLCLATSVSAPILPLFTLPVMLIGFPRPIKFWPTAVGASESKCDDTLFYRQVTPALVKSLRSAFSNGTLCWSIGGSFFLVRFHDRLVWISVLERGYAFYTVNVKGLELQVTSCHSTEVSKIDGLVDRAFDSGGPPVSACNPNPITLMCDPMWRAHIWSVKDTLQFITYSDARNQLVGIMDSPDLLKAFPSALLKCIVWQLVRLVERSDAATTCVSAEKEAVSDARKSLELFENPLLRRPTLERPPPTVNRVEVDALSLNSRTGSVWSDSDDSQAGNSRTAGHMTATGRDVLLETKADLALPPIESTGTKLPPLRLPPPVMADDDFGLAAFDGIGLSPTRASGGLSSKFNFDVGVPPGDAGGDGSRISSHWKDASGKTDCLRLPEQWLNVPINSRTLQAGAKHFPADWFHFVLKRLGVLPPAEVALLDQQLDECYAKFVTALAMIILDDNPDLLAESPRRIFNAYKEKMSWHPRTKWLEERPVLKQTVVMAVRYAVKVSLDELILGSVDSDEELCDLLEEYDRDWYIGSENDPEWEMHIVGQKANLFSLEFVATDGIYRSRTLSRQECVAPVGSLNSELVRAQWSNLNLELLYMTNDDDERYSIQAQPTTLRNLTVQAADPPLGYPIYSSPPISVPRI